MLLGCRMVKYSDFRGKEGVASLSCTCNSYVSYNVFRFNCLGNLIMMCIGSIHLLSF